MARSHALVHCSILDSSLSQRTVPAQLLYRQLLERRERNTLGVIIYRPSTWAKTMPGLTTADIEDLVQELERHEHLIVDRDTLEVVHRTHMHHDGVLKQAQVVMAAAKARPTVESPLIGEAIDAQIPPALRDRWPTAIATGNRKQVQAWLEECDAASYKPPRKASTSPTGSPTEAQDKARSSPTEGQQEAHEDLVVRLEQALQPATAVLAEIQERLTWSTELQGDVIEMTRQLNERTARRPSPASNEAAKPEKAQVSRTPRRDTPPDIDGLGKGEARILTAIAQHPDGCTRQQLTVLTGYKRSSRDTYIQRMKAKEIIRVDRDVYAADHLFDTHGAA